MRRYACTFCARGLAYDRVAAAAVVAPVATAAVVVVVGYGLGSRFLGAPKVIVSTPAANKLCNIHNHTQKG